MELRSCSQLHYIQAIKNGSVVKTQNIFKGRPTLKYKSLADIFKSEDAKSSGSFAEVHPKSEFETEVEISCPPFAERRTREIESEAEIDCHFGDTEENDCDDFGFSMMTLKEIMKRCKVKKRKRSNYAETTEEKVHSCSPSKFSHFNFEPEEEKDDHEVPLSSWKAKLKRKMKLKKKRHNDCVCNSASSAIIVKSEPPQDDENLHLWAVDDLPMPKSMKIEPIEIDYSDCQSMVCIYDNSSFTADEDSGDYFSSDPELPISFIEESHCCALTLVPHEMDDDEPDSDSICHFGICGETEDSDPSEGICSVSGFESDEYTNHPCGNECLNAMSAGIPNSSGCNSLQSFSSKDEMQGPENSETQVQVPNLSVYTSGSHMLGSGEKEFLSSHSTVNGVNLSTMNDGLSSDSEVCNKISPDKDCSFSWNADISVSRENQTASKSVESDKGVFPSLFDSGPKNDVTLNLKAGGSSNPVTQCSTPSAFAVNSTRPTAKDCSSSWNLGLPASGESCVVSVKNNSLTKDPITSDYAGKRSAGIQHHDDVNELATPAGYGSCGNPKLRRPQRLLSTRKIISPPSQKRLRQILDCIDLQDDDDYKCRDKGAYTPDYIGVSEKPYQNRRFEVTFNPKQPEFASKPNLSMKKPKDSTKDTMPKDTVEIYQHSRRMPNVSTGCDSIESWSQSAIEFSKRQMRDMDRLAARLLNELKSMKDVVEGTLQSKVQPALPLRCKTQKVEMAIRNATRVEEITRRCLSTMSRDCNRFCKIMDLTGKNSTATASANAVQRERKISFADETGEALCQVKVFEADMPFTLQSQ